MIHVRQAIPAKIQVVEDDEGLFLEWELSLEQSAGAVATRGRILRDFCGLADAKPKKFLSFARHYGVLGLCQHEVPAGSCAEQGCAGWSSFGGWRHGRGWPPPMYTGKESLEVWRLYARYVRAIRNAGQSLHNPVGYPLSKDDRGRILLYVFSDDLVEPTPGRFEVEDRPITREVVTRAVDLLLLEAQIIPVFTWAARGKPYLGFQSASWHNLLAPVTVALAHELLAEDPSDAPPCTCASCHQQYTPKKRQDSNVTTWCPKDECKRAKNAYYTRLSRARSWDREHPVVARRETPLNKK